MDQEEIKEKQIINLRRRIEHFLRNTSPELIVRIAEFINITMNANVTVPKLLKDTFSKKEKE